MERRFPFDPANRSHQMNPAQLRAVLGFPPVSDEFFLQQTQAQHQQHSLPQAQSQHPHDLNIRRLIQEQQMIQRRPFEQQHELQVDLHQQILRNRAISEQLAAHQLSGNQSQLHQQQQQQQHAAFIQEQLLLRSRQQGLGGGFHPDDIHRSNPPNFDVNHPLHIQQQQRRQSPANFSSLHSIDALNNSTRSLVDELQERQHDQAFQRQHEEQVRAMLSNLNGPAASEAILVQALEQQRLQQLPRSQLMQARSFSRGSMSDDSSHHNQIVQQTLSPDAVPTKKQKEKRPREMTTIPEQETIDLSSPGVSNIQKAKKKRRTKAEMQAAKAADEKTGKFTANPSKGGKKKAPNLSSTPTSIAIEDQIVGDKSPVPPPPPVSDDVSVEESTVPEQKHDVSLPKEQSIVEPEALAADELPVQVALPTSPEPVILKDQEGNESDKVVEEGCNETQEDEAFVDSSESPQTNDAEEEMPAHEELPANDAKEEMPAHVEGMFNDMIEAADEVGAMYMASEILAFKVRNSDMMSESEAESDDDDFDRQPSDLIIHPDLEDEEQFDTYINGYRPRIPQLPEEPIYDFDFEEHIKAELFATNDVGLTNGKNLISENTVKNNLVGSTSSHGKSKGGKCSSVLANPYPPEPWWPSMSSMKKELRNSGEVSDEDDFEETPSPYTGQARFRANEKKIQSRLSNEVEPGVLEKLPHCMIHRCRMRQKKHSNAPELVYCWQVTELYPNDIMVNCSKCGTWRHAACGGHYKPFSIHENTSKPFVAVCDFCSEEEKFLLDNPAGARRLENQRAEHIRRALATTAVMRHAGMSKPCSSSKWPPGSVSPTQLADHVRSVQSRQENTKKMWTDMVSRLGKGKESRQEDRIRNRRKEFKKLLVSIEDAEAYTERHNMMLFLARDIEKEKPAGLEYAVANIFDPEDDDLLAPAQSISADESETHTTITVDEFSHEGDNDIIRTRNSNGVIMNPYVTDETNQGAHMHTQDLANGNGTVAPTVDLTNGDTRVVNKKKRNAPRRGICIRDKCRKRRRFDSQFCSDACGVATLEKDLLRTLQDASDIHPSLLRAS